MEIPGYNFSYKSKPEKPVVREAEPEVQPPTRPIERDTEPEVQPASGPVVRDTEPEEPDYPEPQATERDVQLALPDQIKAAKLNPVEVPTIIQNETGAEHKTREPVKKTQVLAVLGGGTFQSGQVVVSDSLISSVNEVVQSISAAPDYHVVIEGHTDNEPIQAVPGKPYKDNMDLSFLRARAIARILIEKGIPRERISVAGYGDTRPVASNDSEAGKAKNRRVEVKLVPVGRVF